MLLFILCPVILIVSTGWADTWEDIRNQADSIETVQANFVQEKHLPILSNPLISTGSFYFKPPRSLRWEYISPIESVLLIHNGQINRFIKKENDFYPDSGIKLAPMQIVMDEITLWLSGKFQDNPNFHATLEPGPIIKLTPREKAFSAIIQKIELVLSDRPGLIETVTIFENENSFTKLIFKDSKLNESVDNSLFEKVE